MQTSDHSALRFVVLRHEPGARSDRPLHWDFMIQVGDVMRTWALASEPDDERLISAQALADHRLAYLDYQGPLSDGRGCVAQWGAGAYQIVSQQHDRLILTLAGGRLQGVVELTRQPGSIDQWTFRFCPGRAATSS